MDNNLCDCSVDYDVTDVDDIKGTCLKTIVANQHIKMLVFIIKIVLHWIIIFIKFSKYNLFKLHFNEKSRV